MEKIELSDKVVQVIASAAERLIGYFYAGLLPVIILSIERGSVVKAFVEATGGACVLFCPRHRHLHDLFSDRGRIGFVSNPTYISHDLRRKVCVEEDFDNWADV
jgi:hypothetical protein